MISEEEIASIGRFEDAVVNSYPSLLLFSFEKMVEMPDEYFAQYYLTLMSTFRETEGWWEEGKIPNCSECGENILGPKDLRMYESNPYHPHCFRKVFEKYEREDSPLMQKYWKRVLELERLVGQR